MCTLLGLLWQGPAQLLIKKCQLGLVWFFWGHLGLWDRVLGNLYSFMFFIFGGRRLKAGAPKAVSDPTGMH